MISQKLHPNLLPALSLSVFAVIAFKCAWVTDDAYITFRTVDNFIHGYGLTWNTAERVQVYTHPLWMFLVSAVYFFTHEIFYTSIFLSLAISLIALLLFAFRIASSTRAAVLGITILTCSKAFIDYSTSGLENPLTHLILTAFFLVYFRSEISFRTLLLLSLIAAMGVLNRMDTILIFAPLLVYTIVQFRRLKGVYAIILGFLPFFLWECFSLFYYGFPFPNTAYTKLNTGIERIQLVQQGLYYLWYSFRLDPLTLLIVACGLAVPFLTKEKRHLPLAAGVLLYLLYTIKIGGDFMSGRFLTVPLFCAVILVSRCRFAPIKVWAPAVLSVLLISLCSPCTPLLSGAEYGFGRGGMRDRGIEDQRGFLHRHAGLLSRQDRGAPTHHWAADGWEVRKKAPCLAVEGAVGYFGYYAGPEVHVLDINALTDPLMARLPTINALAWRIGHFARKIPAGYKETLLSGQNRIRDRKLAAYYDRLSLITRGDLFDLNRWEEIWRMNAGKYDDLLNFDFYRHQNLAVVLASQGRQAEALDTQKKARSLDPSRAEGWYILAKLHQRAGNLEGAYTALAQTIRLDSAQPAYRKQLLKLGRAYYTQGHTDRALAIYEEAHREPRQ